MNARTELFRQLLTSYTALPARQARFPTFMEIAGYPHLENVCSNILEFYLQPENPHGFGDLLLATLCSMLPYADWPRAQEVEVRREETTSGGKRLDLVVETDAFVIGIENKVFHDVVNPFDEYQRHLQALSAGRPFCGVLLSLRPSEVTTNLSDFHPVRYEDFFRRILDELEARCLDAREPYLSFFHDLVRTLSSLNGGQTMDAERITFFHDQRSNIEALLTEIGILRDAMRQTLHRLAEMIDTTDSRYPLRYGFWHGKTQLWEILYYQADLDAAFDLQITINLSPSGWRISLFNTKGDRAAFEAWLTRCSIKHRLRSREPYRLAYSDDDLAYEAPLTTVQERVQELFRQISILPSST